MKIRSGFVSNSSSSSFVIIGKEVDIADVATKQLKKHDYICETNLSGNEGYILLHINSANMLKAAKIMAEHNMIAYTYESYASGESPIQTKKPIPKGTTIISLERDYTSPDTFSSLLETLEWEDDKTVYEEVKKIQ